MGFFAATQKAERRSKRDIAFENQKELLADYGKSKLAGVGVQPHGDESPDIYVLCGSPTKSQLKSGLFTKGESGSRLRKVLGRNILNSSVRFGSVVREWVPDEYLDDKQVQLWRGLVSEDIAASKPKVIIGVGPGPLSLVKGTVDVNRWRGRIFPVKIGGHTCWYLPIYSPTYLMQKDHDFFENDCEIVTKLDTRKALDLSSGLLDHYGEPLVVESGFMDNIEIVTGENGHKDIVRIQEMLHEALTWETTAIDYEAQNLRPYLSDSALLSAALSNDEKNYAFALDHPHTWNHKTRREVLGLFGEYLAQTDSRMIAHNLSMEQEWTAHYWGFNMLYRINWEDTMAQGYVLDSRKGMLSLDDMIDVEFGFNLKPLNKLNKKRMVDEPVASTLVYNGGDTKWTHALFKRLEPRVEFEGVSSKYRDLVDETASLVGMQIKGIPVSQSVLRKQASRLRGEINEAEQKIQQTKEVRMFKEKMGRDFQPTSPDDCAVLYRDLLKRKEGIVKDKDSGKESYTTDEGMLNSLPESKFPSAKLILEHRAASKLKSTYVDPPRIIATNDNKSGGILYADGLLHPNYNGMFTATGRLSSDKPNAQNYPKRKNKWIREMVQLDDHVVVSLDFGQIEARVFAMLSKDPRYCDALWHGLDVHREWAIIISEEYPKVLDFVFDKYYDDLNKKIQAGADEYETILKAFRGDVKNQWVFPQFFGAGWRSCAKNIGLPDKVAEDLQVRFWDEFEGVKAWQDELLGRTRKLGYVETMGGLRRHYPMSKQENINTPVQGTAAEIVKRGLRKLSEYAAYTEDMNNHPNKQIHDDLTFVMPIEGKDERIKDIAGHMVGVYRDLDYINVPLIIEAEVGEHWGNQKVYGEYSSVDFGHKRED